MNNTRKIITFIFLLTVFFIIFYVSISIFGAYQIAKSNRGNINISPIVISSNFENVSIPVENNTLYGWFFKGVSNKLIIMIAGFRQNRVNNDYFGSLIAKELIAKGYNVLLYDNQATGESAGNNITFGIKESNNLISVVDFAKQRGFLPENIGIIGDSMGAISLLLASDSLKDVGAMVVDSPAKNLRKTMENILQNENHVPYFLNFGIFLSLKYIYHVDIDSIQTAKHVANAPERIFLYLHGGKDTSIYPSESQELLAISNPKSKLVIFPNGKHIETYKSDPELYRKTVFTFLKNELNGY